MCYNVGMLGIRSRKVNRVATTVLCVVVLSAVVLSSAACSIMPKPNGSAQTTTAAQKPVGKLQAISDKITALDDSLSRIATNEADSIVAIKEIKADIAYLQREIADLDTQMKVLEARLASQ